MRKIAVISGKGGVGKTTVVANLGVALSRFNKKVVIIDCNLTTSHLGFYFGFSYYPVTLNNVLREEVDIKDATYIHPSGLSIVPASVSLDDLMYVEIDKLKESLKNLEGFDVALLDSAPGLGKEALATLKASEEAIFVTIPFLSAVTDVMKSLRVLDELNVEPLGIILNMVKKSSHELTKDEIESLTGLPVIGIIPYDKNIEKSLAGGIPPLLNNPYSPSSIEFMKIAANLVNETYNPPSTIKRKILSAFSRFLVPRYTLIK